MHDFIPDVVGIIFTYLCQCSSLQLTRASPNARRTLDLQISRRLLLESRHPFKNYNPLATFEEWESLSGDGPIGYAELFTRSIMKDCGGVGRKHRTIGLRCMCADDTCQNCMARMEEKEEMQYGAWDRYHPLQVKTTRWDYYIACLGRRPDKYILQVQKAEVLPFFTVSHSRKYTRMGNTERAQTRHISELGPLTPIIDDEVAI
jgi:hypothetical protein